VQLLDFEGQLDVTMEQFHIAPDARLASRRLGDLAPRDAGLIVVAIGKSHGKMIFNPPAAIEVAAGDVLIVMGEQAALRNLEKVLTSAR
jgi:Trk K+ transport system NAD-binding subunit